MPVAYNEKTGEALRLGDDGAWAHEDRPQSADRRNAGPGRVAVGWHQFARRAARPLVSARGAPQG